MKWLLSGLLVMVVSSSAVGAEPASAVLPAKEKFHLYLLIGQSNMAGRGKVEAEDQKPHPRVLCFNQQGEWVPAVDPLHFDKPKVVGVGLGRSFGIAVAEQDPDVTIGLIPCAVGGSSIMSWEPGGYDKPTKTHPYDDMLKRCEVALQSGTLKGILWHQGESDSNAERSAEYEQRLHTLIQRLRTDLHSPDVPFIAGQLGQFKGIDWSEGKRTVDAAHRSLPEKVPHTGFVSSEGLVHKGDKVHFDAASLREFGKRYAKVYQKVLGEKN